MKKLAVLFFAFAMSVTTTFANNDDDKRKEERKELRTQIVKLLGHYDGYSERDIKAEVTFMINKKGEIVIISVESTDANVASYVKSKLNYRFVKNTVTKGMKVYKLPLSIVRA
ncbi:MAG: hypothetical protein JXR05_17035 [Flavobacteriaceae bacterium]